MSKSLTKRAMALSLIMGSILMISEFSMATIRGKSHMDVIRKNMEKYKIENIKREMENAQSADFLTRISNPKVKAVYDAVSSINGTSYNVITGFLKFKGQDNTRTIEQNYETLSTIAATKEMIEKVKEEDLAKLSKEDKEVVESIEAALKAQVDLISYVSTRPFTGPNPSKAERDGAEALTKIIGELSRSLTEYGNTTRTNLTNLIVELNALMASGEIPSIALAKVIKDPNKLEELKKCIGGKA